MTTPPHDSVFNYESPFGDFNVQDLESPHQRALREAFAETEQYNQEAIAAFDPAESNAIVDLELHSGYPELEAEEPQIAEASQQAMLRALGVKYEPEGHADRLFEFKYADGEVKQIRLIQREGALSPTPVYIELATDEQRNTVERVCLTSTAYATEYADRFEAEINEQLVNHRLATEFDLDQAFLEQTGLSYEDKRGMLDAHDKVKEIRVAPPGNNALDTARRELLKRMMPITELFAGKDRLPEAMQAYEKAMESLLGNPDFDRKAVREFRANEELLRLSGLNERLKKRVKVAKIGAIALTGIVGLTGAAVGVGAEVMTTGSVGVLGMAVGAVMGGGVGLMAGKPGVNNVLEGARRAEKGFDVDHKRAGGFLQNQLVEEHEMARDYLKYLRSNR